MLQRVVSSVEKKGGGRGGERGFGDEEMGSGFGDRNRSGNSNNKCGLRNWY